MFEKNDADWIERYIAWKKANPEKVKEWTVETEARVDRYIELDENYDGLQRNWKHNGTHSLIQVMRFGDGLPRGPFIPGQSRYFASYKDQEAVYGPKPYDRARLEAIYFGSKVNTPLKGHSDEGPDKPNSPLELSDTDLMSEANNKGGHLAKGQMGGCSHDTGQTTPIQNPIPSQQNVTIQPPSNPPQSANMPENRKVYYTSDELWEAYKAALPAWPHLAEKTRRFVEQSFRNSDMSQQRLLLRLKLGDRDDKNTAA